MSATQSSSTRLPQGSITLGDVDLFVGDYIDHWAAVHPEKTAITFIDYLASRKGVESTATYAEVDRRSRAIAARLAQVTAPGDRVAILAPQGADYILGFVGALRSHAINVPLYAPDLPGHGERLEAVVSDCKPAAILTVAAKADMVREFAATHAPSAEIICVDDLGDVDALAAAYAYPEIQPSDVAYLQYTSGSTRTPAGVVLTHRNLMVNVWQLVDGHAANVPDVTTVSWLPLFHDMGLLLGGAAPMVAGAATVLIDPVAFILKPQRWLEACSGRQDVMTAAPNFAFDYAVKRVKPDAREQLDLSGVASFLNGAEPILASTLENFRDAFASCGVKPDAVRPGYGLAEATVFVSITPVGEAPTVLQVDAAALQQGIATTAIADGGRAVPLVSSGRVVGQHLAVVDPETRELLPEGQIGEIWINGGNVGDGYWQKPEESEALFGATLEQAGDLPAEGWLRTEDLGVLLDGGRLFVTGRIKDLIIVDGRNIYPQDVEYTVEQSHEAVAQRRLAAFSVTTDAGESMVVVAERYRHAEGVSGQLEEIASAAKASVSAEHAIALHDFVLVEPDTIARTSSGKIARKATRAAYLEGTLQSVLPTDGEHA